MTDVNINSRVTWTPTESGAEQWNRATGSGYVEAFPGEPITCLLWEFMWAIGPIVGLGSGAAASAIDIEVTKTDRYTSILRDLNMGRVSEVQAIELIVSVDPSIPQEQLNNLLGADL
jgi:hypothetical protein